MIKVAATANARAKLAALAADHRVGTWAVTIRKRIGRGAANLQCDLESDGRAVGPVVPLGNHPHAYESTDHAAEFGGDAGVDFKMGVAGRTKRRAIERRADGDETGLETAIMRPVQLEGSLHERPRPHGRIGHVQGAADLPTDRRQRRLPLLVTEEHRRAARSLLFVSLYDHALIANACDRPVRPVSSDEFPSAVQVPAEMRAGRVPSFGARRISKLDVALDVPEPETRCDDERDARVPGFVARVDITGQQALVELEAAAGLAEAPLGLAVAKGQARDEIAAQSRIGADHERRDIRA